MTANEEKPKPAPPPELAQDRADPVFKELMLEEAILHELEVLTVEFAQITRADMVLGVPDLAKILGTLFDFFRRYNIIEFKSENDQLDFEAFIKNVIRTHLFWLENQGKKNKVSYKDILHVIISARFPESFFAEIAQEGIIFTATDERPWLFEAQVGLQKVVVVVCRNLPIEEKFLRWLVFAPSNTKKWKDLIVALLRQGGMAWLKRMERLKPREFGEYMASRDILELMAAGVYAPEVVKEYNADMVAGAGFLIQAIRERYPQGMPELVSQFRPEEWLVGLKPEERLVGLTEEQRQEMLKLLTTQQTEPVKEKQAKPAKKRKS